MKFNSCFILLLLLLQYKKVSSNLEQELQRSVNRAIQCTHRVPPKDPVMALSPMRFTQLVTLLRKTSDPPVCDKSRSFPPFRLEDVNTWTFCIFGICKEGKCQCFRKFHGPTCAQHSTRCWLMYCFLTSCHSSLQSFNCKCDSRLDGSRVTTGEYWYDDGKRNVYQPPPSGFYQGAGHLPGIPYIGPGYNIPIKVESQEQNQDLAQQERYSAQQDRYLAQQERYLAQQSSRKHSNFKQKHRSTPSNPFLSNEQQNLKESTEDVKKALDEMEQETSSFTSVTEKKYSLCSIAIFAILAYYSMYFFIFE
ncbi:hypothetical protein NPIL_47721 [Nephila pilipes]|uniref:Uncharacterized protein n=1 Tax=Nephila pilipes TaxID=299642 RepID=A0A8X6PB56_NEPPI|nr:hypothetical protein NPIL_47721 [Nephila pilipes]